jgi:hypothetical protein
MRLRIGESDMWQVHPSYYTWSHWREAMWEAFVASTPDKRVGR